MDIYQGDIVWVSFPFSDGIQFKERPALVLSKSSYNKLSEDILLAYITSQESSRTKLIINEDNILNGQLQKVSYIRYDKILLVEKGRIQGIVAVVTNDFYKSVVAKICEFISAP